MKFFIRDFFSKCDQICSFLRIWSHLLKKSLMETSFFVQCKQLSMAQRYCNEANTNTSIFETNTSTIIRTYNETIVFIELPTYWLVKYKNLQRSNVA